MEYKMNQRLRELERQAQKFVLDIPASLDINEFTSIFNEKFAELIVRECGYHADVFESLGCPVDMDPIETKPSDYIKKHFGVEE